MSLFFTLLFFASLIFIGLGLVSPRLVVRWGTPETRTRKKVFVVGVPAMIIFLSIAVSLTDSAPPVPSPVPQQVTASQNTTTLATQGTTVPEPPVTTDAPATSAQISALPQYDIVQISDISTGQTKRYNCDVVIQEPTTPEQLKTVCVAAMEKVKKEKQFDELIIFLYDYPEYIGQGTTLGKVTFSDKEPKWNLLQKDWSLRLTADEVKVNSAWFSARETMRKSGQNESEKTTTQKIAKQFKLTPEVVDKILTKKLVWQFDGD